MSDISFATSSAQTTLVGLLRRMAFEQPERLAYTFLRDGESGDVPMTYAALDREARAIGAWLQSLVPPSQCALLLYPPGPEYLAAFFGCLYAGVVAVPAYPPRNNRHMQRLESIAVDSGASIVLTTSAIRAMAERTLAENARLSAAMWLVTDHRPTDLEANWKEPVLTADMLAFLQYTSGSTGVPKGVMLTHQNLIYNSALISHGFGLTSDYQCVIWLPPYHDMGLIGGILQPLYTGFPCTLMSPVSFLQRPLRWLQTISRYKRVVSGGPNFAYDLCIHKITPEERATLDLSGWEVAFSGAEPVRPESLDRFVETFGPCGFRREAFYPCYGLAEATLFVSGGEQRARPVVKAVDREALERDTVIVDPVEGERAQWLVGCGQNMPGQKIVIVDHTSLTPAPVGRVGEVWVSGPSVAQGYWKRRELTEETFRARLADTGSETFLRTGDLGFMLDGELFITGRLKDLIIIRGRNYYPQDLEWAAERSHDALRPGCGAAFGADVAGEERLVIVHEVERHLRADTDEVIEAIRRSIAEAYDVQVFAVVLIRAGSIPKTTSGKIQRYACRDGFMQKRLDVVAQSTLANDPDAAAAGRADATPVELSPAEILAAEAPKRRALAEAYLCELVARILKMAPAKVGVDQPLSALGLDSLAGVELSNAIEANLGVSVALSALLQGPSVRELAAHVVELVVSGGSTVYRVAEQHVAGDWPLSRGQQALWFLYQTAPQSAAYNVPAAFRICSSLDVAALQRTFQRLIDRHSVLRSTFVVQQGKPLQRIGEASPLLVEQEDAAAWSEASLRERLLQEAYRPFRLEQGPPMRVRLFTRSAEEHILLVVMHHIVTDFWSLATLTREMGALYAEERTGVSALLAPVDLFYAAYVRWQDEMLAGLEGERHWQYWQQQLAGELPLLDLPTDKPRPAVQTYDGASAHANISAELLERLRTVGQRQGATLYMTLLAAYQVLMHRYTGQEDVIVGSPAAGRSSRALSGLVGYLVNPLPLRTDLSGNPTFTTLLSQVRQTVLDAIAHQDYPFPLLVDRLQPDRDPSRSPLFQTLFTHQQAHLVDGQSLTPFALGIAGGQMRLGELALESVAIEHRFAQFDLSLTTAEVDDGLAIVCEYNTDLFEEATILRLLDHFQLLLEGIATRPDQRIAELPLLTVEERQQLLVDWNSERIAVPPAQSIVTLFEAQAERTPTATALVSGDERFSYAEIDRRSNQLAHYLRTLGIGPDRLVGLCMERSWEMVVGLLGILKAGGAYVPLDPAYPQERVALMLEDAGASALLTQARLLPGLPAHAAQVVCLDTQWEAIAQEPEAALHPTATAENLAYVIYTSGSTGRPKGVAIAHRSTWVFLHWVRERFTEEELSGVLASTSICFDLSVFEIFGPLSWGGKVVVAQNALQLPNLSAASEVRLINTVPSAAAELVRMRAIPPSVQTVNLAGEPLPNQLAQQLYEQPTVQRVYNLYGPTEDTTYSTYVRVRKGSDEPISIGRPLPNSQAYLLDASGHPVPTGVVGELYLGGEGLARGYLNRPEMTAERFVPDPFCSQPGARLYRTGDLARYRGDANIEYLGRIDHQVKVRGFRIELGEVQESLRRHPALCDVVVLAREDVPGDKRLVAYFTATGQAPSSAELRSFLRERLPEYMVPAAFVCLESMPLTPNGKINRQALPVPHLDRSEAGGEFAAPRTPVEEVLASMWAHVLGVKQVGIHDDFFKLGGHSLLVTQVVSLIHEVFDVEVPLHTLFKSPTVAELAALLIQNEDERPRIERIAELVLQIGQMSDDEVGERLNEPGRG